MNKARKIENNIEELDSVDGCTIKTGHKVWFHVVGKRDVSEDEIINDLTSLRYVEKKDIKDTYEIDGGLIKSPRIVIKISLN